MLRRILLSAAVGPIGLACADGPADRRASAGPVWRLVEELRIGSESGAGSGFWRVAGLAAADDGTLYVLDGAAGEVRAFDAEGRFLGTLGRRGSGPGEFVAPAGLGLLGDTLWVLDRANARVTFFGRRGGLLGTYTPAVPGSATSWDPVHVARDGSVLLTPSLPSPVLAGSALVRYPLIRVRPGEIRVDTVAWLSAGRRSLVVRDPDRPGPSGMYAAQPFADHPLWTVSRYDDALIVVLREPAGDPDQASFEILRIGLGGDTVARRRVPYVPAPLEGPAVERALARLVEAARGSPALAGASEAELRRWVRAALYVPPWLPPVDAVVAGSDGSVWLREARLEPDSAVWQGYGPVLEPIGRVRLPPRAVLGEARGPHLWAVLPDTLDVPHVVRFRRVPATPPAR